MVAGGDDSLEIGVFRDVLHGLKQRVTCFQSTLLARRELFILADPQFRGVRAAIVPRMPQAREGHSFSTVKSECLAFAAGPLLRHLKYLPIHGNKPLIHTRRIKANELPLEVIENKSPGQDWGSRDS